MWKPVAVSMRSLGTWFHTSCSSKEKKSGCDAYGVCAVDQRVQKSCLRFFAFTKRSVMLVWGTEQAIREFSFLLTDAFFSTQRPSRILPPKLGVDGATMSYPEA